MKSQKILTIIMGIIAVVSAVFLFMILNIGDEAIKAGEGSGTVDTFMNIGYVVLFLTIAIVLVFVIKGLFAGNIKKTLMSVGAFLVILVISYAMSSGTDLNLAPFADKGITEATSKYVGAGLNAFYALGIIAIGSMLFSGIKNIMNK